MVWQQFELCRLSVEWFNFHKKTVHMLFELYKVAGAHVPTQTCLVAQIDWLILYVPDRLSTDLMRNT